MNRNTLIALVIVLGMAVMLLLYRLDAYVPPPPPPDEEDEEEEEEEVEEEVLDPQLEVLPEDYNATGGLPGLVRVFDGGNEVQLAGGEEYTCATLDSKFVEEYGPFQMANALIELSGQYTGEAFRLRRFYDNVETDIAKSDQSTMFKAVKDFLWRKADTITTDFDDFGVLHHCYGIKRMVNSYTGPLFAVRNGSGVDLDIDAVVDEYGDYVADQEAILNHCGTGDGNIVTLYDQKGSADLTIPDNRLCVVTSGVLFYEPGSQEFAPYVKSNYTSNTVSCDTLTDDVHIVTSLGGGSGDNYQVNITNSSTTDSVSHWHWNNGYLRANITTSLGTFNTFTLRPFGTAGFNKLQTSKFSPTSIDTTYSSADPVSSNTQANSYGTYTVNQISLIQAQYNFLTTLHKNCFQALAVYSSITDMSGLRERMTQLHGVNTGGSVISAYDQSGNSNGMQYFVAGDQPILNDYGFFSLRGGLGTETPKSIFFKQKIRIEDGPFVNIDAPSNTLTLVMCFANSGIQSNTGTKFNYLRIYTNSPTITFTAFNSGGTINLEMDGAAYDFGAATSGEGTLMLVLNDTEAKIYWQGELKATGARSIASFSKITRYYWENVSNTPNWIASFISNEDRSADAQVIHQELDDIYNYDITT